MEKRRTSSIQSDNSVPGGGFSVESLLGICYMLIACIFWVALNITSKFLYLTTTITPYEVVYFRCMIPILISLVYCLVYKIDPLKIPEVAARPLFLRCVNALFGFALGFLALKLMSYSKYMSLAYVYPMLTQIAAYFMIHEKLTIYDILSCISSFCGVIIISTHYNPSSNKNTVEPRWAFIVPLGAAVFWALGDVYQRKIKSHIHAIVSPIYQYLISGSFLVGVAFISDSIKQEHTHYGVREFVLLFLVGAFGVAGTGFYALAFQKEKAGRLSALNYLSVPYALLSDYFIFHEVINWYNILGAFLIISGSCTITILKGFGFIN